MSKIRILLVDDHILVRMGLVSATKIAPDMEVIAEIEDGDEALNAYRLHQPDVAVIDLRMPKSSGVDVIASIRREFRDARLLVLSNYASGDDVSRAMQAGASGYVVKGMPLETLLQAIRTVYSGETYIPPEIATRLAGRVHSQLSTREIEVLRLIANGMSNKELGTRLNIAEGTVKIHVANILSKLGVADRTQAVVAALKRNLLQLD
jgi:DNA-binding NarL/FixJ family response regulator